jgi:hypothetical protein
MAVFCVPVRSSSPDLDTQKGSTQHLSTQCGAQQEKGKTLVTQLCFWDLYHYGIDHAPGILDPAIAGQLEARRAPPNLQPEFQHSRAGWRERHSQHLL